jgi:Ras-related GTP-binding protein A/B
MDLINEDEREAIFLQKRAVLKSVTLPLKMVAFKTSIWDETLYKARNSSLVSDVSRHGRASFTL